MRVQATLIAIAASLSVAAHAGDAPPTTPEGWAAKMTDPTRNGSAFKDPRVFVPWAGAMMDPATSIALMQRGMDPNAYTHMMGGMMNPASMQNWMQFIDPAVAMRWMQGSMDPNLYTAMMMQTVNPAMYAKWMAAPMDPRLMGMMAAPMNPSMYANWMGAATNPANMNLMMAPANPAMYNNWMGAAANPATYGPWGGMMAPLMSAPMGMMNPATTMPTPQQAPALNYGVPGYSMPAAPAQGAYMPFFFPPRVPAGAPAPAN